MENVLEMDLGILVTLQNITPTPLLMLSNKKSIPTDLSKLGSLCTLTSWLIKKVFMYKQEVPLKADMLLRSLAGVLMHPYLIGLLLTLGDLTGELKVTSGWE